MAKVRKSVVRQTADNLLKKYAISACPVPVQRIAEGEGVGVFVDDELPPNISGYLARNENGAVIVVQEQHHPKRQRFSIAHELGHFLLHSPRDYRVSKDTHFVFRDEISGTGTVPEEIEANQFAAELLMPKAMVVKALESYTGLSFNAAVNQLASDFDVSPHAMGIRLSVLGLVNPASE